MVWRASVTMIILIIFIFFKRFSKKCNRKIKNDDTKTGITQVLIELQQKFTNTGPKNGPKL